jgi:hypothetical protein
MQLFPIWKWLLFSCPSIDGVKSYGIGEANTTQKIGRIPVWKTWKTL